MNGNPIITLLAILTTHISVIIFISRWRKNVLFKPDLERLYSTTLEFLTSGSILRALVKIDGRFTREILFNEEVSIYKDQYIDISGIEQKEVSLDHIENQLSRYTNFLDEYIDTMELKTIFQVSTIIFPPILIILSTFFLPLLTLAITPIIQISLYIAVNRWMK